MVKEIMKKINDKKEKIEESAELKQKLEEQIIQYEERGQKEKDDRALLKKEVEKLKIMKDSLDGETDLGAEVKELEEEVKYL